MFFLYQGGRFHFTDNGKSSLKIREQTPLQGAGGKINMR
jgi:hypothetical protein